MESSASELEFESCLNKLTIHKLEFLAYNLPHIVNDEFLHKHYPLIHDLELMYPQLKESIPIRIAHLVNEWAPTMMERANFKDTDNIFLKLVTGSLELDFLEKIKKACSNLIESGSTFLYVNNATNYAIFNSRIYNRIIERKDCDSDAENCKNYAKYIEKLRSLRSEAGKLRKIMINRKVIKKDTTEMRCMEISLNHSV